MVCEFDLDLGPGGSIAHSEFTCPWCGETYMGSAVKAGVHEAGCQDESIPEESLEDW